jgi:hypothetical protein
VTLRRTPLRAKRPTPRRTDPDRVRHVRTRPRAGEPATAEQRRYWSQLPQACQGCGRPGECIHHLLSDAPGKTGRRDHWFVVRLCGECHNLGTESVHLLGSERAYEGVHGVDLVQVAMDNVARHRAAHG